MTGQPKSNALTTGLAVFSMFFGAGNVVFPLAIGLHAQDKNVFASLGLLITAVGLPFIGLIAMTLFNGNYVKFFGRVGKIPGFLIALTIVGLIGPFGALPRCVALSYSTTNMFFPGITLPVFSFVACLLIFALTIKQNKIVDIVGRILTPLLLIALFIIIIKGLFYSPDAPASAHSAWEIFIYGMKEGYQTVDLPGAFFFASVALICLEDRGDEQDPQKLKAIFILMFKASCLAAFLLGSIYLGLSYTGAFNSERLAGIPKDQLLGALALDMLGPYAGVVACAAVALACLTTAIALAAISAEFIHKDISLSKISYGTSLGIALAIAFFVSILNFNGIINMLAPILYVVYPALIVLSVLNILYKMAGVKVVKWPVAIVFLLTLALKIWEG